MAVKEKIRIRLKGYDHSLVDQSAERIVATAKRTGARVSGPVPLPTEKQIVTILRAVHKYKDSREQFEIRTHKRLIDILRPSNKTVEALMSLELPAGVDIEIKLTVRTVAGGQTSGSYFRNSAGQRSVTLLSQNIPTYKQTGSCWHSQPITYKEDTFLCRKQSSARKSA